MTAHKHAKMIKAKADNMELVVFANGAEAIGENDWFEYGNNGDDFPTLYADCEYFLCLPKHKEACLHWLNGGEIEMQSDEAWMPVEMFKNTMPWHPLRIFMEDYTAMRIKPRKEKLWLAVKTDKHEHLGECRKVRICSHAFVNKSDAEEYLDLRDSQLIEIEVEV